jgi:hypothetical protein
MASASTANLALVDFELAEHQRWGAASATVGAAGSEQRAEFVAQQAGAGLTGGFAEGGVQGLKLGLVEAFSPVPGVGAVIGGVQALEGLKEQSAHAAAAVHNFGEGSDTYDILANSIAAVSAVIDVVTGVLGVFNGVLGVIEIALWAITAGAAVAAIFTAGATAAIAVMAGEAAEVVTDIKEVVGVVMLALSGINSLVLQPVVLLFRTMHTMTSQADPRAVEAQGAGLKQSAGSVGGFLGGLAGAAAAGEATPSEEEVVQPTPTEESPPPPATEGPSVTFEEPTPASSGEPPQPPAANPEPTLEPSTTGQPGQVEVEPPTEPRPGVPQEPGSPYGEEPRIGFDREPGAGGLGDEPRIGFDREPGRQPGEPPSPYGEEPRIGFDREPGRRPGEPPSPYGEEPRIGFDREPEGGNQSGEVEPEPETVRNPQKSGEVEPEPETVRNPQESGEVEPEPETVRNPQESGEVEPEPETVRNPQKSGEIEPEPETVRNPPTSVPEPQEPPPSSGTPPSGGGGSPAGGAAQDNLKGMQTESLPSQNGAAEQDFANISDADIEAWGDRIDGASRSDTYFEMDAGGLQDINTRVNPNPNQISYNVDHYMSDVSSVRIANASDVPMGAPRGPGGSVIPEGVGVEAQPVPETALATANDTPVLNANGEPIGNQNVEVRYHSANPGAPEGSASHDNPSVQVNTPSDRFGWGGDRSIAVEGDQGRYLTPDGRWVTMDRQTPQADKAAAHFGTGEPSGMRIETEGQPTPESNLANLSDAEIDQSIAQLGPHDAGGAGGGPPGGGSGGGPPGGGNGGGGGEPAANAAHNAANFERLKAQYAMQEIMGAEPTGSATKGGSGYVRSQMVTEKVNVTRSDGSTKSVDKPVKGVRKVSQKVDAEHSAPIFEQSRIAEEGRVFPSRGDDGKWTNLTQMPGGLNGKSGIYEYVVDEKGNLTHQKFIEGGSVTGEWGGGPPGPTPPGSPGTPPGGGGSEGPIQSGPTGADGSSTGAGNPPAISSKPSGGSTSASSTPGAAASGPLAVTGGEPQPPSGAVLPPKLSGSSVASGPVAEALAHAAVEGAKSQSASSGGDKKPSVEPVNPKYPPPPGTPQQLKQIQDEISQTLAERAKAEEAKARMEAEQQKHQSNVGPAQQAIAGTQQGISATQAHQQDVALRDQANKQQQAKQQESQSTVGGYADKAAGLAALSGPLTAFRGFTSLASHLPGNAGAAMAKMNADGQKVTQAFDQMGVKMAEQAAGLPQHQQELQSDNARIQSSGEQGQQATTELQKAEHGAMAFQQANEAKIQQAASGKAQAASEEVKLDASAKTKTQKAATLAEQLQAWAAEHKAARQKAVDDTKEKLKSQGKVVTAVKEE